MSEEYKEAKSSNVRMATPADKEKLLDFVKAGHNESAIFSLSEHRVKRIISDCVHHNPVHPVIIGVIDSPDGSVIAASLAVEYTQAWYSEDWFLCELWNNVRADYRKSHYGRDLLAFGKKLAEDTSRPLSMGIITTDRLEAKMALYRRKMPQVGAFFMYNLNKCLGPAILGVSSGR